MPRIPLPGELHNIQDHQDTISKLLDKVKLSVSVGVSPQNSLTTIQAQPQRQSRTSRTKRSQKSQVSNSTVRCEIIFIHHLFVLTNLKSVVGGVDIKLSLWIAS